MLLLRGCSTCLLPLVARGKRALLCQGYPPSFISWLRTGGGHCLIGVSPSIPWPRTGSARCWMGGPSPSSISWLRAGGARVPVRVTPYIPWPRVGDAR